LSNEVNEEVKYDKNRWNTFISAKTEVVMGIMTTIAKTQHLQRKTFNLNENFDLCWETIWSLTNIPIRLDLSKRCLQNSLKFSSNQQFNNILNAKLTTVISQRYNYLAILGFGSSHSTGTNKRSIGNATLNDLVSLFFRRSSSAYNLSIASSLDKI
jgi:hypothetical protein